MFTELSKFVIDILNNNYNGLKYPILKGTGKSHLIFKKQQQH